MAEEEQDYLFDEIIDIFDYADGESGKIEIYLTREDNQIAFIQPDENEIWLSPEDAVKLFILLGKALKSVGKVSKLKLNLEYELK